MLLFKIISNNHHCPRNAFLGLYESKLLINCSIQPITTKSNENKYYALIAVQILKSDGRILKNNLLHKMNEKIGYSKKQYRDIADVVLALWDADYIEKKIDLTEEIERLRKKINPSVDDILGDLDI